MTQTASISALQAEVWASKLYKDIEKEMFFSANGFIGTGPEAIIQKNTELSKKAGDTIHFPLTTKLSGSGKENDDTLEGYEEAISSYEMSVSVAQLRNAVRLTGIEDESKVTYNMRADAKDKLKIWGAETLQENMFTTLATSPTTNRIVYCSADHSTVETLDTTDLVIASYLGTAKRKAQLASPKIRPIMHKGKPYYVVVLHPYCMRDLKAESSSVIVDAFTNAWWRGEDNPLFTGASLVYDGLIIHEHEDIYRTNDGASSVYIARNLLLGQQAGSWAVAKDWYWREKKFDYDNQYGIATGIIQGFAKTAFNSEDYGCLCLYANAKAD